MLVYVLAGEGPGFDPACSGCCVAVCTFHWIPLHCWNVSGADVWVVVDVVVEIIDVWVAVVVSVLGSARSGPPGSCCCYQPPSALTNGVDCQNCAANAF